MQAECRAQPGAPPAAARGSPTYFITLRNSQVLVVRCDLDMGVGKIGAQCGHASVGSYKRLMRTQHKPLVTMWERGGATKIVVRCKNQQELMEV